MEKFSAQYFIDKMRREGKTKEVSMTPKELKEESIWADRLKYRPGRGGGPAVILPSTPYYNSYPAVEELGLD